MWNIWNFKKNRDMLIAPIVEKQSCKKYKEIVLLIDLWDKH